MKNNVLYKKNGFKLINQENKNNNYIFLSENDSVVIIPLLKNDDSYKLGISKELIPPYNNKSNHDEKFASLISGTIKPNEDPDKTAIRELKEETGIQNIDKFKNNLNVMSDFIPVCKSSDFRIKLYSIIIPEKEAVISKPSNKDSQSQEIIWVDIKNLPDFIEKNKHDFMVHSVLWLLQNLFPNQIISESIQEYIKTNSYSKIKEERKAFNKIIDNLTISWKSTLKESLVNRDSDTTIKIEQLLKEQFKNNSIDPYLKRIKESESKVNEKQRIIDELEGELALIKDNLESSLNNNKELTEELEKNSSEYSIEVECLREQLFRLEVESSKLKAKVTAHQKMDEDVFLRPFGQQLLEAESVSEVEKLSKNIIKESKIFNSNRGKGVSYAGPLLAENDISYNGQDNLTEKEEIKEFKNLIGVN